MIVEFKSSMGCSKRQKELTDKEFKIINNAINQFEEENPRRKKLVIDLDFVVPLIKLLRNKKK